MAYVEELHHYNLSDNQSTRVDLEWPNGLGDSADGFAITPDGFVALLANGIRHEARRYYKNGNSWAAAKLDINNVQELRASKDARKLVFMQSSATSPPRWSRAMFDSNRVQNIIALADVNADLRKKRMAKTEVFRWKGALDEEIEGLVSYPHDYQEGKKYPLVVLIHGGPHWADFDHWDERWAYVHLLCPRAASLRPNYHGSSHMAWPSRNRLKAYTRPSRTLRRASTRSAREALDASKIGLAAGRTRDPTMSLITRRHYRCERHAGGSEGPPTGACATSACAYRTTTAASRRSRTRNCIARTRRSTISTR